MPTSATWILTADSARARLFSLDEPRGISEVGSFANAEARMPARALQRDRLPRTHDRIGNGRHAIEPHARPHEKAAARFAALLQSVLERGRVEHRFERLVLIAPPHFLGVLNNALDRPLRACVALEIPKDMTRSSPDTVVTRLLTALGLDEDGMRTAS